MTHVEAAKTLRDKFSADGLTWTPEHYRQLTARSPDGVPEAALDEVVGHADHARPAAALSALLTATEEGCMLVLKQRLKEARIPQAVVAELSMFLRPRCAPRL